ncbi:MAG: aa3-type cytochrome c oxidase subunit IV [Nitratireductor sp.]|nr:aa3-type cytochrome c oxidase subunit IV [Nitratireductor sp.]MCB1450563.1 aa3-type cytochrome c oxidase subunit IV [Nitratireductor sp.]
MAKAGNHGETANAMDYAEHERTYHGFLKLTKWTIAGCVALLIAMAAGFFAGFGLFGGIVVFAILVIASYFAI